MGPGFFHYRGWGLRRRLGRLAVFFLAKLPE